MSNGEARRPVSVGDARGEVESGVVVLTLTYEPDAMYREGYGQTLANNLLDVYERVRRERADEIHQPPHCIVDVQAETAGSPVLTALVQLYKAADALNARVITVGYPEKYMESMVVLGLLNMEGFDSIEDKGEALSMLASA